MKSIRDDDSNSLAQSRRKIASKKILSEYKSNVASGIESVLRSK
jgi:hypothetical protein